MCFLADTPQKVDNNLRANDILRILADLPFGELKIQLFRLRIAVNAFSFFSSLRNIKLGAAPGNEVDRWSHHNLYHRIDGILLASSNMVSTNWL